MFSREKKVILPLIYEICRIAERIQRELKESDVVIKPDLSVVTVCDFVCQALINKALNKAFPKDALVGEEDALFLEKNPRIKERVVEEVRKIHREVGEKEILEWISLGKDEGGKSGRFWTIDPIDGTKGFVSKEHYVVAIALIEEGKVVVGALGCPTLVAHDKKGILLLATSDEKSHFYALNTEREFFPEPPKKREVIYCEQKLNSKSHSHSKAFAIAERLDARPETFRLDSQCKYALVALGEATIYLRVPKSLLKEPAAS
jgi:3'(2'), 5'-bisphosphate nucleotidase